MVIVCVFVNEIYLKSGRWNGDARLLYMLRVLSPKMAST